MKAGYRGSGLSEEEVNHRVYGALNNRGYMHGSQETAAGDAAETRFLSDHKDRAMTKARAAGRARKYLERTKGGR